MGIPCQSPRVYVCMYYYAIFRESLCRLLRKNRICVKYHGIITRALLEHPNMVLRKITGTPKILGPPTSSLQSRGLWKVVGTPTVYNALPEDRSAVSRVAKEEDNDNSIAA